MSLKETIASVFSKKNPEKKKDAHSSFSNFLRDYFTFNRRERNGIIVLISLIAFISILTFSLRFFISPPERDTAAFQKELDAFLASAAPAEEDAPAKPETNEKILTEINTADSVALLKIKGIGPYIAMKIIEKREKLGGFFSKEQLREVHRIDSSRYEAIIPFLRVDPLLVKRININTARLEDLNQHPYISSQVARSLLSLREQYGNFKNIDEIKKSHLINADLYRKIAPYLSID